MFSCPLSGTRFRPLSFEVPKPLFPVAGVPMIQHHIEACAQVTLKVFPSLRTSCPSPSGCVFVSHFPAAISSHQLQLRGGHPFTGVCVPLL